MNNSLTPQQKEQLIIKAARDGFPEYCIAIDSRYQLEWFHEIIALKLEEAMERLERGEDVRLMIFMPPRHGKSDMATQKFPSWVLGKHPEYPVIVASYSQELATDFGLATRDIMESHNYRGIFDSRLRADQKAKAQWMTEAKDGAPSRGGYTSVGIGGTITGKGFKIGIVDDPFKNREEADSPVTRESVHKWWRSTFYTRQEGNTAIILILTRWHDDDLAGRLLKEQEEAMKNYEEGDENYDKWEVLQFKAISEEDEAHRKNGEALWSKKFALPKLLKTKAALGSYEWSSLYQQNPIDEESQEFKKAWLKYKTWDEIIAFPMRKFATIDCAGSKEKIADFTGVTRNFVNADNDWHFNTRRYKINSKELIDLIFQLHSEGMEKIGIEEGIFLLAVKPFLDVEMEKRNIYPNIVTLKHHQTMKETRIRGLIPRYQNGKIYHIENTCVDLEEEYARFPKAVHDDCLDSAAYQNQIAQPPTVDDGDRLSKEELIANITRNVNDQTGTIIIGVSTATPVHYTVGNKQGIFYNRSCKPEQSPYKEIDALMTRFKTCFVVADQVGDILELKELQAKYRGRVYISYLTTDKDSQQIIKWGKDEKSMEVHIGRNQAIQMIVDEVKGKRFTIHGSTEDWKEFSDEWTSIFRVWDVQEGTGTKSFSWESNAPQHFVKSTIYFRVGLDRHAEAAAVIIGGSVLDQIQTGRIF